MILLLGGTGDTNEVASVLAQNGYSVLVSMVTDYPLTLTSHPKITKRTGALTFDSLTHIIQQRAVTAIVDATHPYAEKIGKLARDVTQRLEVPYFRYMRAASKMDTGSVTQISEHSNAAAAAFAIGKPVLLTIGSLNLTPYVTQSKASHVPLAARVLDSTESVKTCLNAGIVSSRIITGRGPFCVADNISLIHRFGIGVLVTKDGGAKGGFPEKLEAAGQTGCKVIVVKRPFLSGVYPYESLELLIQEIGAAIGVDRDTSCFGT